LCRNLGDDSFFVVQIETHRSFLLSSHNTAVTRRPYTAT